MGQETQQGAPRTASRAAIGWGLVRALLTTTAVGVLYFVLPFDRLDDLPVGVGVTAAMVGLLCVTVLQVQGVLRAAHPAVRAVEALAVTVPVFLLVFAATYYLLARDDPSSFNVGPLTRSDALYFTVTVFATVGFGDVAATTQVARRVVTAQMVLDLMVLGLGIRVFMGAVERGRSRSTS